eukprot:TCALIF_09650-PA protein Name:"Protein of unknown function" AED:0.46 eAED:0.49 QI:0/0/0/0.33/1/1/3/0/275
MNKALKVNVIWLLFMVNAHGFLYKHKEQCYRHFKIRHKTHYEQSYETKCTVHYKKKCHTDYDIAFDTKYENECYTTYQPKCQTTYVTTYDEECQNHHKKMCHKVYETIHERKCVTEHEQKFLLNLVFSNLLWNLVLIPILLFDNAISTLEDPEFRSKVAYTVFQFFLIFGTCASLLSQLLIGTDQYLAVVDPLHYNTRVNTKRCYFMCGAVWGLSFMVATLNVINYEELGVVVSNIPIVFNTWPSPSQAPSVSTSVFTSSFAVMLFLVPFGVLTF